ncbi:hypothetical protein HMPREF0168_0914 [Bifidobacterium dentium ATCC 27679]|uniref:Uncharacterized protein n=1 Tax=Bifidobacterium dentium ATCC 27679 TaxID=871562 RepID=E0Q706_9BIFI|nr:hypothetical protein HMPREF0168_0914 [Bifidobacterium dentium ATCC 27679]
MDDDRVMGVSSRITPFAGHADELDDIPTVDVPHHPRHAPVIRHQQHVQAPAGLAPDAA